MERNMLTILVIKLKVTVTLIINRGWSDDIGDIGSFLPNSSTPPYNPISLLLLPKNQIIKTKIKNQTKKSKRDRSQSFLEQFLNPIFMTEGKNKNVFSLSKIEFLPEGHYI